MLQDEEFTKLGSTKRIAVDVRVVTATNRDLEVMMNQGQFREDLYYRLKVIEAVVPPLRQRLDEIPALTDFFIQKYAQRYNRPAPSLSEQLRRQFQEYSWPGNVRELENMIKRFVILRDEELVLRELSTQRSITPPSPTIPATASDVAPAGDPGEPDAMEEDDAAETAVPVERGRLADIARAASLAAERSLIADTLERVKWNRRKTAEILGVSYKTLLNKIKETGLEPR